MRIGLVCPYNFYRPGGVQICIREMAEELRKRGHYIRIIAPKPRKLPDVVDDDVILIGNSAELKAFATKVDVGASVSNTKLEQILTEHQFDVIHFHEPGLPFLSMQLVGLSSAAHVATLHATLPQGMVTKSYQTLMRPVAKYINTRVDVISAVSPVAEATGRVYIPDATITIVPNGIKLKDYKPKAPVKRSAGPKTIVYVGRLEKRKGVKYLLEAFALLRTEHNARLIIAGQGDLRPTLEAYVDKHDIKGVTFKGYVSEDEKITLMQKADLYCSPAPYGESFGIVLLEAMAAGTVVVAGNNPGYASVMTGKGRLSLVNPESTVDFAQRLELMLYDEEVRSLWLKWAKQHVEQFDYVKVVDQYEALYKKALRTRKARTT
ncbi:glycosyltransferase family 1 protein [Candidatus Saccharibacteria bacterium]|nr:MAG: glycosyltransferase family 1 protein [Candidatus Saccharibacteria bacterium]